MIAEYHSDPVPPAAGGGGTSYLTSDHLGSTRVVTKQDGTVKARYDYLPFGEELPSTVGGRSSVVGYSAADGTRQKFTQKERDSESGLDYFLATYYSSAQGRFTGPDEFVGGPDDLYYFASDASKNPTFYADLDEPQSLNKYQYCYNNPLRFTDLDGHQSRSRPRGIPGPSPLVPPLPPQVASDIIEFGVDLKNVVVADAKAIWRGIKWIAGSAEVDPQSRAIGEQIYKAEQNRQQQQQTQDRGGEAGDPNDNKPVFGEKGTQTTSTTAYQGKGGRIDVENPNPGQRPGQIHYQDKKGNKYLYDPGKKEFTGASATQNKRLLSDPGIQKGIQKGLKVLGESN